MGHREVVLRTDNEPAIKALAAEVRRLCQPESVTIIDDHPAEGEHAEHSAAEKAVGTCKGTIRTLKDAPERRIGRKTQPEEPVTYWLAEYAGYLISFFRRQGR